jgi:hypothetical protein
LAARVNTAIFNRFSGALKYVKDVAITIFRTSEDFDLLHRLESEIPDGCVLALESSQATDYVWHG